MATGGYVSEEHGAVQCGRGEEHASAGEATRILFFARLVFVESVLLVGGNVICFQRFVATDPKGTLN